MTAVPASTVGAWNREMSIHRDDRGGRDPEPLSPPVGTWPRPSSTPPRCRISSPSPGLSIRYSCPSPSQSSLLLSRNQTDDTSSSQTSTLPSKDGLHSTPRYSIPRHSYSLPGDSSKLTRVEFVFPTEGINHFGSKPVSDSMQRAFERTVRTFKGLLVNDFPVSNGLSEENACQIVKWLGDAYKKVGEDEKGQKEIAEKIAKFAKKYVDERPFEFIASIGQPYGASPDDAMTISSFAKIAKNTVVAFRQDPLAKVVWGKVKGRSEGDVLDWDWEDDSVDRAGFAEMEAVQRPEKEVESGIDNDSGSDPDEAGCTNSDQ